MALLQLNQIAILNNFLVGAKLLILAFFFVLGLGHMELANFATFAPSGAGVLNGAFYIFFAFGGFARVAVVAEEVKDARRNVPRAILLSPIISTIIYILVGVVAIGLVGASVLKLKFALGDESYEAAKIMESVPKDQG